jgi:hypothetical protein
MPFGLGFVRQKHALTWHALQAFDFTIYFLLQTIGLAQLLAAAKSGAPI